MGQSISLFIQEQQCEQAGQIELPGKFQQAGHLPVSQGKQKHCQRESHCQQDGQGNVIRDCGPGGEKTEAYAASGFAVRPKDISKLVQQYQKGGNEPYPHLEESLNLPKTAGQKPPQHNDSGGACQHQGKAWLCQGGKEQAEGKT